MIRSIYEDNSISATEYLTVDHNCVTECPEIELESIVALLQSAINNADPVVQEMSDEEDADQQNEEERVVPVSEAYECLRLILIDIKFQMTKDFSNKKIVESNLDSFVYHCNK